MLEFQAEELIAEPLTSTSVQSAMEKLLSNLASSLGLDRLHYYIVDHSVAGFHHVASNKRTPARSNIPLPPRFPLDTGSDEAVIQAVGESGFQIPVRDSSSVVGLIHSPDIPSQSNENMDQLVNLAASCFVTFAHEYVLLDLLKSMQQPLPYAVSSDEFYQSVVVLIAIASSMEFVAIREVEDTTLRCLGLFGFPKRAEQNDFDISIESVPIFRAAISRGVPLQCRSLHQADEELVGILRDMPNLRDIESFVVVPLKVGESTLGLLSLASRLRTVYSEQQLTAFLSLGNSIGVAIANFQNFHNAVSGIAEQSQVGVSITAVEVAQAVRHEAKAKVANIMADLLTIQTKIRDVRKDPRVGRIIMDASVRLEDLAVEISGINDVLEKIQAATKPPDQLLLPTSVENTWISARDQVIGRLNSLKVKATFDGPDQIIEAYPDWLRHVFLNLLLNSADAFQARGRRNAKREIRLRYRREASTEELSVFRYSDTAGGITADQFTRVSNPENLPLAELIFQPDVTTKSDGSGWGMVLVRQILSRHDGSIVVVSLRSDGGVVFDIKLPRTQARRLAAVSLGR